MEFSYPKDRKSPTISYKLWSDITFVNFKEKAYISYGVDNLQMLEQLHQNGFVAIDTAVADTIMRLNSIEGCETTCVCSGHPGDYRGGYIYFLKIPDGIRQQMDNSPYWEHELDDGNRAIWRLHKVEECDSVAWLKGMLFLAELDGLPKTHNFKRHHFEKDDEISTGRQWVSLKEDCYEDLQGPEEKA